VAWLQEGKVRQVGAADEVIDAYLRQVSQTIRAEEEAAPAAARANGGKPAVEIGDVRVLGRDGSRVKEVRSGDRLLVEIPYRVNDRLKNPRFQVSIRRDDGVEMFSVATADGVAPAVLERDGSARVEFRSVPLLAGTYGLAVTLAGGAVGEAVPVDERVQRSEFEVVETADSGAVELPHEWISEPAPVEVPRSHMEA
jgi:hypothetical protein